jgi:polysaccharide export outer membrane protein
MDLRKCLALHALAMLSLVSGLVLAQVPLPDPPPLPGTGATAYSTSHSGASSRPGGTVPKSVEIVVLVPGDQVKMTVFGRPEMETTTYVGSDGAIRVPLAGPVLVGGLSPGDAAQRIEGALKAGQFLVNPHVTLTVVVTENHISVLGEVKTPGRYAIESNTTVLDALALAGGRSEKGDDEIYLLREESSGEVTRMPINLRGLNNSTGALSDAVTLRLHTGDKIFVPLARQIYVSGEVRLPAPYRLESGMTVLQAIALAGGVTEKGSNRRVEIRRRKPEGGFQVLSGRLTDTLQPDDVITVKERIF